MRMSVILLILGIVVAAAGIASVGFGIPINEFTLGTTLIITGTTALTGGLILIGLSAVVSELGRVVEGLKSRPARGASAARTGEAQDSILQPPAQPTMQPAPQPMLPPVAPPAPVIAPPAPAVAAAPRPLPQPPQPSMPPRQAPEMPMSQPRQPDYYPQPAPSAVEVSAAAIERLRSSIPRTERPRVEPSEVADIEGVPLSPNGAGQHRVPQPRPPVAEPPPEPRVAAEERGAAEALKASRLDFLFRSKGAAGAAAGRPAPQPESFDAFWPADGRGGRNVPAGSEPVPTPRADPADRRTDYAPPAQNHAQDYAPERRHDVPPADEGPAPSILKSGVVDGMAYTLYSDGSIEAKLPQGTVRFGSIAELRAHIESNS
jgi:hypothetical protein